jgi:hypothetical protein
VPCAKLSVIFDVRGILQTARIRRGAFIGKEHNHPYRGKAIPANLPDCRMGSKALLEDIPTLAHLAEARDEIMNLNAFFLPRNKELIFPANHSPSAFTAKAADRLGKERVRNLSQNEVRHCSRFYDAGHVVENPGNAAVERIRLGNTEPKAAYESRKKNLVVGDCAPLSVIQAGVEPSFTSSPIKARLSAKEKSWSL